MTNATGDDGPIGEVQEGMTVLDSAGDKVGTVRAVRMGDPQAATAQGQERAEGKGILGQLAAAFETDTLPDAAKERLARLGFLRVDATGLFSGDRYVASNEIAGVRDEVVHLSVTADHLIG